MTGQKAGFDDSKLRRDLVRVQTGKEFLDQRDQRNRPNLGKLNLRTLCNFVDTQYVLTFRNYLARLTCIREASGSNYFRDKDMILRNVKLRSQLFNTLHTVLCSYFA